MNKIKLIWLTIVQLFRQASLIPQNVGKAIKQRQRQTILAGQEAERRDRILNPSKYRGK